MRYIPFHAFLISPPEEEPLFRFGATLIADRAIAWFDGPHLVWSHGSAQRCLSLHHLRGVRAHEAELFGHVVKHLELLPATLDDGTALTPSITLQSRFGAAMEQEEPDFHAFAARFLAALRRFRPFLSIEGDEAVLLSRRGC
jgi:hypothetical protein